MTLLVVAGAAVLFVIAAGLATVWARRRRARRDLEGHFQNEWVNRERWASLADGEAKRPGETTSQPEPIRTDQ
jgi:hypothetical protein